MTIHEIESVERALSVRLPDHYRDFALHYPDELAAAYIYYSANHRSFIAGRQLRNSDADLIELNRGVREPGVPWTEDDGTWPDRYFVIGDDSCGGYFAVDLEAATGEVYYYEHESGTFITEAPTLAAFATSLIAHAAQWNAEHEPPSAPASPRESGPSEEINQLPLF